MTDNIQHFRQNLVYTMMSIKLHVYCGPLEQKGHGFDPMYRLTHSGSDDLLKYGGPLSLGPIPSDRLKSLRDVGKWSSLSLCLSVRGISLERAWTVLLCSRYGSNSALSLAE